MTAFTVPGKPVPKGRPRINKATGAVYTARRTQEYEDTIGNAWIALSPRPAALTGNVSLYVSVYEGSHAADLDNYVKIVGDALNTLAWLDDKQVTMIHATIVRQHPNPRLEVEVLPL